MKKVPKFIYLFFSDYTLMGCSFAFFAFTMTGTVAIFGDEPMIGLGIGLYLLAVMFLWIFFNRVRSLKRLFQYGVYVKGVVKKVSILSIKYNACDCRVYYTYKIEGVEHSSSTMLHLSIYEVDNYKGKTLSVLVHPRNPNLTFVQDSLSRTVLFFSFLQVLFTRSKGKPSKSKKQTDHPSEETHDH